MKLRHLALAAALALGGTFAAHAQQATFPTPAPGGIKRTILQKVDVPGSTTHEVVMGMAEIPAGVLIGRHTHFGAETGTVIDGELTLMVEGQPDKVVKVGESYQIGVGLPHDAKAGDKPAKVIAVYVIEKGKALATPAPKK